MPIALTTVNDSDDSGFRRSRRRHRHQKKQRWQIILAIVTGLALLGGLAAWLLSNSTAPVKAIQTPAFRDAGPYAAPGEAESIPAPPAAPSVGASSSGELPEDRVMAKVLNIQRVSGGADNTDHLQVEYEFTKTAKAPSNYLIIINTPAGTGPASFSPNAARRDIVVLSMALNSLGSRGPIRVWIESKYPAHERVSNVMILP